ncbi:hypothetical protein T439DRAFT_328843 [Meredithblackwellia eburnea MCA 4105]
MAVPPPPLSPATLREMCRSKQWTSPTTAGFAPGFVQANVLVIPDLYAADFRLLCRRNPAPCPLLGETAPGDPRVPSHLAKASDIRFDVPSYTVYENGKFISNVESLENEWKEDSVAFFIGCSFTFEDALVANGLIPRHVELGRNVPMYKTKVPLCPAGVFSGHMVVSMRPYPQSSLPQVRSITRPYILAHGEPVAWGIEGAKQLGITDLDGTRPDFGDPTEIREGEIAVYWACGVTPQLSVMDSGVEGRVFGHAPGQMLVLDLGVEEVLLKE